MRDKLKIRYVVLIVLLSVVWATQLIPILGEVYAQSVYPVQNNCTYKEIWTHTTARLLWCVAELFRQP
jgi:ubiquinone biosynthesis protein UbiJ